MTLRLFELGVFYCSYNIRRITLYYNRSAIQHARRPSHQRRQSLFFCLVALLIRTIIGVKCGVLNDGHVDHRACVSLLLSLSTSSRLSSNRSNYISRRPLSSFMYSPSYQVVGSFHPPFDGFWRATVCVIGLCTSAPLYSIRAFAAFKKSVGRRNTYPCVQATAFFLEPIRVRAWRRGIFENFVRVARCRVLSVITAGLFLRIIPVCVTTFCCCDLYGLFRASCSTSLKPTWAVRNLIFFIPRDCAMTLYFIIGIYINQPFSTRLMYVVLVFVIFSRLVTCFF